MRIGIVQSADTKDVRSSSGTTYFMAKALENHVGEVFHLGPDNSLTQRALRFSARLLNRITYLFFRRRISPLHNRFLANHFARFFSSRIPPLKCDVIFAPFASVEISFLETNIPIVYHTDMPWVNAVDYYEVYSNLFCFARAEGEKIEAAALSKAVLSFFPSAWAARSVVEHYDVNSSSVYVIPYGANFEKNDLPTREAASNHNLATGVNLLWMGVDWERKGGPIAYECLMELLAKGIDATLTICGCKPPKVFSHGKIKVVPFLSKIDPEQRKQLSQLFLEAHFFLFPTTADAVGIVLCEASAHGLPSLVATTGGVESVITEGVNGYLLPITASGKQYAAKIIEILSNPQAYDNLVQASRQLYEAKLNWDIWGKTVKPILEQAIQLSLKRPDMPHGL